MCDTGRITLRESGAAPADRSRPVRLSLSFRYYEGRMHHRYGNLDLVLDDAGH